MPSLHARLLHGTRSWSVTAALLLTLGAGHTQGAPFSIVLIPDTQNYYLDGAGFHADNVITCITDPVEHTTYECQMRWIATNQSRLNIRAAIHLGDMTNGNGANTPAAARAWAATSDAHRILDVAGVPYAVVPGNHDHLQVLLAGGHVLRRDTRWFDWFFPPSRFQQPWYVDSFPREPRANRNNAIRFTAGALKFVVISLDFAPEKDAVCWADSLARALTDHRIIVATHCYQGRSALRADSTRPAKYQPCAVAYHIVGMDGEDIWNEFVALHSNIVLAVSGHVQGGVGHTVRVSRARSTPVHEILVDYQEERYAGRKHGAGWMRVLEFDPTASLLRSHPISVLRVPAFNARTSSDACGTVALCYVNDPAHKDHTFETAFDVAHMAPDVHREPFGFADRLVNDRSDGDQNRSRIAMMPNGDFVATWQDDSEKPTGYYEIFGRAFRRDGCALVDGYRVNQNSHHQQREPDVAVDARGSTVVVWADDSRGTEGLYQVYARGLLRDGTQRFFPFTVNQVARGDQRTPRVTAARDGRFFVTWTDTRNDEGDIFVRGFDAGGHPLFSEVRVNEGDTNGLQDAPDIAVAGNGTLTVVWHSGDRIRARYFSPNGSTLGTLQSVATSAGVGAPAVAVAGDGHGAVTWRHGTHAIRAHQFTVGTDMSDGDIVVTNAGSGRVDLPAVDVASTGDFIVAWQDDADANNWWQIHSQAFTAGGAPRGAVQTVNKNSRGQQTEPSVAVAAGEEDGRGYTVRWVVSWTDDLDRNGKTQILARGGSYLAGAARKPGP